MKKQRNIKIIDKDEVDNATMYWLQKTPEERLSTVEFLREQYYLILGFDEVPRLSKIINIVEPIIE